jgi:hypothetical protein
VPVEIEQPDVEQPDAVDAVRGEAARCDVVRIALVRDKLLQRPELEAARRRRRRQAHVGRRCDRAATLGSARVTIVAGAVTAFGGRHRIVEAAVRYRHEARGRHAGKAVMVQQVCRDLSQRGLAHAH